ncbi:MAG: hypothetical protein KTR20_11115 [Cellvibrionaceae bacterium]|nr:hypothetical protein [Cellvibrionaceae bacterium]
MSQTINPPYTPTTFTFLQAIARGLWPALFLLPLCLWLITTDTLHYWRYGAPIGQGWYVFSKLFALYGVLLLWYQGVSSLLKSTPYAALLPAWRFLRHRMLGVLTLCVVVLHIACFVTAVSLRKETLALGLLWLDFRDFYHGVITLGLVAFWLSLLAIAAAVLRQRYPDLWRHIHRFMMAVIVMGLVHGYLIGTETRYGVYEIFYLSLFASFCAAMIYRWRQLKRATQ